MVVQGIVTRFTLQTLPQTFVYQDQASNGEQHDPKATIITSYNYFSVLQPTVRVFYDAPKKPDRIFDEFLSIPALDVIVWFFDTFVLFFRESYTPTPTTTVSGSLPKLQKNPKYVDRIIFCDYSLSFLERVVEANATATRALLKSAIFLNYNVEPFLHTLLNHNTTPSATIGAGGFGYANYKFEGARSTLYPALTNSAQSCANTPQDGSPPSRTVITFIDSPSDSIKSTSARVSTVGLPDIETPVR
ncbi:hypothetical protein JVT61DRAFT_10675 [Boletus reticuloceps]|uniref:Uncharacterized protein n=1 Tax=Boletus reticuloceps TaxID=495285 RepID=A0A8I2YG83_9AGAM|nr:hypothetical protein JVT61DRAFT_10675 [Boletus reticuloceps]